MTKTMKVLVSLALLAAFGGALVFALRDQHTAIEQQKAAIEDASVVSLKGVIAVDVEEYFKDPRVQKVLAANKLPVQVTRMGSRDMAGKVVAGASPDFFFPSGVVAANQITEAARKANVSAAQVTPFYTPLVIASWEPIVQILVANGLASKLQPHVYGVDMEKLTRAMLERKRWKDLKASEAYPVSRSLLVSTTDVRRSNSAAMYLALTSAALKGDMVTDLATARQVAAQLAELFKRQGYQENYVNGNFDDYKSQGMGKTPLAWIYENQLVGYALANKGIQPEMVLMYPQPTINNKVVFIATNERAKALGQLLATNAELQSIAVEYGFRIADAVKFANAVKPTGLAIDARLANVIDPPSAEVMAEMIDVVSKEMAQ